MDGCIFRSPQEKELIGRRASRQTTENDGGANRNRHAPESAGCAAGLDAGPMPVDIAPSPPFTERITNWKLMWEHVTDRIAEHYTLT